MLCGMIGMIGREIQPNEMAGSSATWKGKPITGENWLNVGYPTVSAASRRLTCQSLSIYFLYRITSRRLTTIEQDVKEQT